MAPRISGRAVLAHNRLTPLPIATGRFGMIRATCSAPDSVARTSPVTPASTETSSLGA
jgi:hypothetical protein